MNTLSYLILACTTSWIQQHKSFSTLSYAEKHVHFV